MADDEVRGSAKAPAAAEAAPSADGASGEAGAGAELATSSPGDSSGGGAGSRRRPRVLVVDDDLLVGRSIGMVLQQFDVVFAQSAAGALGRVGSGRGFAAVVCDFRMPGMDGIQFHEQLSRLDPALARRVVYLTGWAEEPAFEAFLARTRCPWLAKPFRPEALRLAVATACDVAQG